MGVQVVVRTQRDRDVRRLQSQNAKRLFDESNAVKFPVLLAVEYPRGGGKAVRKVDAGELPDVDVVVNDSDGKIDERGEASIEPSAGMTGLNAAILDDDAAADGIRVVPESG